MSIKALAQSKVTQKYQATIPLKVREKLGIQAGDQLVFEQTEEGIIQIKKKPSNPLDRDYLSAIETTLSEWNSPEDDEAYSGVQLDEI